MEQMSPQEEIAFIKKIMQDSRKIIYRGGKEFIYWGILIVICLLHTYFSYYYFINDHTADPTTRVELVWAVFVFLGIIGNIVFFRNKYPLTKSGSLAGRLLGIIWFAVGCGMILVGFIGGFVSRAIPGVFISPLMCSFLGVAYILNGVVAGKKWLSYLAIGWWGGALLMFFYRGLEVILIMALMMVLFQIIPGFILDREAKLELTKTDQ